MSYPALSTGNPPLIPRLPTPLPPPGVHRFWITHVDKLWVLTGKELLWKHHEGCL
jgi:hypothetical protein